MRATLLTTIAVAIIAQPIGALPITHNKGIDAFASNEFYYIESIKHLANKHLLHRRQ